MSNFKDLIAKVADGNVLSVDEARAAFEVILSGSATPSQLGGFLMALRVRGESISEVTGAVETMRAKMLPVEAPADAIDIVGTGGDNSGSYNISTCSAIVVAGCGVPVAKHGNRSLSSKSGAADVLDRSSASISTLSPGHDFKHCISQRPALASCSRRSHHAGDAPCGPGAGRTGNAHDLQSARTAVQSGWCYPPDDRRVFRQAWVEPLVAQVLGTNSVRTAPGSCMVRTVIDEITTTGIHKGCRAQGRQGAPVSTISPEDVGLPVAQTGWKT